MNDKWKSLVEKAVSVLQRHAPPGGISDFQALSELYGIFDGPEYRAALEAARATPAQPVPEIAYAISVKETGADLVISRVDGDITTVLHSEFHPMGDTYGLLVEAPENEAPSPSSVGAAIRSLPLPEHIARADSAINETGALVAVWMNRTGTLSYDTKVYTEAQMRALLSEAAALAEQVQGQQWISVEDRLPPNGKDVVVWCGYCVTAQRTSDKHDPENHNGWVIDFDNGRASAITHWLELPAAPSTAQDGQKSEGV